MLNMRSNIQKETQKQQSEQVYSFIQDGKTQQQWYLKIMPITVGNNSWIIISKTIIFSITLLICLYYGSFSYESSDKNSSEIFSIFLAVLQKQSLHYILVIFCLSSEFYVLQNIVLLHVKKMQNIPIVSSINLAFDLYLLVIIQLNILLSYINFLNQGFFALKTVCFVIANLTVIFSDFFLMPKNNSSDFLYTIETSFMVLFRCSFIAIISATLIDYYISSSFVSPAVSLMLIITLSYEFSRCGTLAYNNRTSSTLFYVSYALLMAISATISLKLFMIIGSTTPVFLFFIILFKIYASFIGYENIPISDNYLTLNDLKAFMAINLSMNEGISVIRKSLLIGLIQIHRNTCMSKNCISQRSSVIQQKQRIKPDNLFADQKLETTIFYYTKCLFELLLDKNSSDVPTLICYCEYLLYEMKMIFPLLVPIKKLWKYKLNVSQQIRFQNIKDTIKEYLNKQNQVNQPKLILQEVISLQNTYFTLKQTADQIINKNIELLRSFNSSISQAQILDRIQQILDLKKTIKANLANSVNFHRHLGLKRLISFFKLYLNNDFKKQREISALSSSLLQTNQAQINKPTIIPIQPIIKAQDCFSPDSIFILAKFSLQKILIIQKVSKSTSNLLGYEQNELSEVQLSTVLPDYLKQKHKQLMISLIDQGFTSNQKSLKAIDTQCLTKDSSLVSVCKSFKTYADMYGQVRFACMLKVNPIQPIIIISSMKNKILQSSSNLQRFFVQKEEYNEKQGFSNLYNDIMEVIKNEKQSNRNAQQWLSFMSNRRKQITFRVKKIEYQTYQPIFSITIIIPQQPSQKEYISQSRQNLKENIQIDFKDQQKPLTNIFMKEQNFIPVQHLPKMLKIKRALYIFGIIYLITPTLLAFLFKYNCHNAQEYFDMKVFFIKSLESPYLLGIFYYQIQMNLQDEIQHAFYHAEQHQSKFIEESLNPLMLKALFDKSLFEDAYIQVQEFSDNGTQLLYFDTKDIFFSIGSFISSYKGLDSEFSVQEYNKFNQMLIPYYEEIDQIKNRLLYAYSRIFDSVLLPDIICAVVLISVFIISLTVICYNFFKLFEVWNSLIKLLSKSSNEQYLTSFTYWQKLKMLLSPQQSYQILKTSAYTEAKEQPKQQIHFKKNKLSKSRLLTFGIIAMVIMFAIILTIEQLKLMQIRYLRQFQQDGDIILEEYPKGIVFSYCLLQRHYNQTVLNIMDQQSESFQQIFRQFNQISQLNYLAAPQQQNSYFYQLYKQYFFANPCTNIPQQALQEDFTYQKCSAYAERHLTSGILSFVRHVSNMLQDAVQDSIVFQQQELSDLIQSLVLVNYFVEQMLRVWRFEYLQRLENLLEYTFNLNLIATSISVIVFYFFILRNFISELTVLQDLHKQAYSILMTKEKIETNKIAQTQLIICGFLEKK